MLSIVRKASLVRSKITRRTFSFLPDLNDDRSSLEITTTKFWSTFSKLIDKLWKMSLRSNFKSIKLFNLTFSWMLGDLVIFCDSICAQQRLFHHVLSIKVTFYSIQNTPFCFCPFWLGFPQITVFLHLTFLLPWKPMMTNLHFEWKCKLKTEVPQRSKDSLFTHCHTIEQTFCTYKNFETFKNNKVKKNMKKEI